MSTIVSWNSISYTVPATGEENWGGTTKVDGLLVSLATNGFNKAGGLFTLAADADFGVTAGLKSIYYKSRNAALPTTGVFRLGNTELLAWRDFANSANYTLGFSSGDVLEFKGGTSVLLSVTSASLCTLGVSAYTGTHVINGNLSQTFPTAASNSVHTITHSDNTSGSSHALHQVTVGGTSGGDPYTNYSIPGGTSWSVGADNSASDAFKVSNGGTLGSTDLLTITTAQSVILGNAAIATNATDGFLYLVTMAGTPTGNSTDFTGRLPFVYDTAADKLWVNTSGTTWKAAAFT